MITFLPRIFFLEKEKIKLAIHRNSSNKFRNFISIIEKTIIETLNFFNIKTFSDKENIGIWYKDREQIKKVAAIGVRISKWIAYHGFSINITIFTPWHRGRVARQSSAKACTAVRIRSMPQNP